MPALKKVLCDGGCTDEAFAAQIKALTGAEVEIASTMNCVNLLQYRKDGLLSVHLGGWINAVVYGKTANVLLK
ncbi:MAG: hypothetical protein LBC93_00800 [Synergistaceae bacterium]|nr:hypothetical protein [Synergistaceae bacterium]